MDDIRWHKLTSRFPLVPADFKIERVQQRAEQGTPLHGGNRPVLTLAFSPDASRIVASGGGLIPGPPEIRVFDVASRELIKVCHYHRMGVFNVAFDPDTGLLASASHDYSVVLWDLERDEAVLLIGGPDAGISRNAAKFLGGRVFVADGITFDDERAALTMFDLASGDVQKLFEVEQDLGISFLDVSPQHGALIAVIDDQYAPGVPEIRCLAADGSQRARYDLEMILYDIAIADANTLVAIGSEDDTDNEVVILDATTGRIQARQTLGSDIRAVSVSPSGDRVALACGDKVSIRRRDGLAAEMELQLGGQEALSVAWSPDGAWIAAGTAACTVRLFDVATGTEHLG